MNSGGGVELSESYLMYCQKRYCGFLEIGFPPLETSYIDKKLFLAGDLQGLYGCDSDKGVFLVDPSSRRRGSTSSKLQPHLQGPPPGSGTSAIYIPQLQYGGGGGMQQPQTLSSVRHNTQPKIIQQPPPPQGTC